MACNPIGDAVTLRRNMGSLRPQGEGPLRVEMRADLTRAGSDISIPLGKFSGDELYFAQGAIAPRPLGLTTAVAVASDRVYLGTGDDFRIAVFSLDGDRIGTIDTAIERLPLDRRRREAYIESAVADSRHGESSRAFYSSLEYPERLPAHGSMLVDSQDRLWVQSYPDPTNARSVTWYVFGRTGDLLALIEIPAGLEVFDVGQGHVLGVQQDDLGVDHVVMYRVNTGS